MIKNWCKDKVECGESVQQHSETIVTTKCRSVKTQTIQRDHVTPKDFIHSLARRDFCRVQTLRAGFS